MDRLTGYMVAALQKPPQPPPKPPIKPVPDWLERIRRGEMKIEQAPAYVPDKGETGGWLQMPPEHLQHLAGDVVRPPLTVFGYPQSQSAEDRWWPKVQAPGGMEAIKSLGGVTNMPPNVLPIRPQSDLGIPQHLAGDVLNINPYIWNKGPISNISSFYDRVTSPAGYADPRITSDVAHGMMAGKINVLTPDKGK